MINAERSVMRAKEMVHDKIEEGFDASNIVEISEVIEAIAVVEMYIAKNLLDETQETAERFHPYDTSKDPRYNKNAQIEDDLDVDVEEDEDNGYISNIKEELEGARNHFESYEETQNQGFLNMAKDRIRHSEFFIKLAKKEAQTENEMNEIKMLKIEQEKMLSEFA